MSDDRSRSTPEEQNIEGATPLDLYWRSRAEVHYAQLWQILRMHGSTEALDGLEKWADAHRLTPLPY